MVSETTPPREAVRPAVRLSYDNISWKPPVELLVIDNSTGGGLVARVRAAVRRTMPNAFEGAWIVAHQIADEVLRECGVQP